MALTPRKAHDPPVVMNGCHSRRTNAAAETGSHVLPVSDVCDAVAPGEARVRRATAAIGGHAGHLAAAAGGVPWTNAAAVGVHTLAYLVVMTLFAWTVYRKLGLRLLRTAWFNLDWLWAGALVVTGAVVLLT
jgi:hypothetical protein